MGVSAKKLTHAATFLAFAVSLGAAMPGFAHAGGFFGGDRPEGWFWYRLPPEPIEPKPVKPQPPKKTSKAPAPKPRVLKPGPPVMSAAWLKKNIPKYLNLAIDRPTRENVLTYLVLQRVAMDKSQRFADMTERVVQTTPLLDEYTRRPISGIGARLANRKSRQGVDRSMNWLSERVGVWFFYSGDCVYCASQAKILKDVQKMYGLYVTAISMDGAPPPPGFKQARRDQGQAEQLGIKTPIALVLVNPEDQSIVPLSHALLTRKQLIGRIILASNTAGWLPDWRYKNTRPMRNNRLVVNKVNRRLPAALAHRARAKPSPVPVKPSSLLQRLGMTGAVTLSGAD